MKTESLNIERAVVAYQDDARIIYLDDGQFIEATAVTDIKTGKKTVNIREIDGYRLKYTPDGQVTWAGADIDGGEINVNLAELF